MAQSFERIHRTNLVGMGVLPLQFKARRLLGVARHRAATRPSTSMIGADAQAAAGRDAGDPLAPTAAAARCTLTLRIDTPIEVDYYKHGGILPFVLRQLLAA